MKNLKEHISAVLSIIILIACLFPALHALSHEDSVVDEGITSIHISDMDTETNCDLCSFNLTTSDSPEFYSFTLHTPLKEAVYIIALEDKANQLPLQLFQLRAPPAVIG